MDLKLCVVKPTNLSGVPHCAPCRDQSEEISTFVKYSTQCSISVTNVTIQETHTTKPQNKTVGLTRELITMEIFVVV